MMSELFYSEAEQLSLPEQFRILSENQGQIAEVFCTTLLQDTDRLTDAQYSEYIETCRALVAQVMKYLEFRKGVLLPYIESLQHKQVTGHNCLQCSDKCQVQHRVHIVNIMHTTRQIKESLGTAFGMLSAPEHIPQGYDYRRQRLSLMRLDQSITELIYLEEACLIPAIIKAQNGINARS